jgi:hypothetical protein
MEAAGVGHKRRRESDAGEGGAASGGAGAPAAAGAKRGALEGDAVGATRIPAAVTALVAVDAGRTGALALGAPRAPLAGAHGPQRSSRLAAPTMMLEGHGAAVTGVAFSPDGEVLASCSKDRSICAPRGRGEGIGVRFV